ncbi:hypothetical protein GWI33_022755 [Rhynchophorus ferrugineus]|uniref:Zinc finger protein 106 n=1 Tax=Rhynchophorus ferrugineus TaxID=354439 RepID=A0A834IS33_RHYFE|nr:hypothetical protein GWI33_022755 [Rhynchophorus ferrugineus]
MVNNKKTSSNQLLSHQKKNSKIHFRRSSYRGKHYKNYHHKYYHGKGRSYGDKYTKQESSNQTQESLPVEGTEEYMAHKIKQTSAIIMRQILSPNEPLISIVSSTKLDSNISSFDIINNKDQLNKDMEKQNEKSNRIKRNTATDIDVKEIHERIMNHIVNLNKGRRKNFINANSSGLDTAIQEIQKQKRLELSRVLRQMCTSEVSDSKKSGELIDSIIPDIGIRLEQLPIDVIEELRATLNFDFEAEALQANNDISAMLTPSESTNEEQIEVKIEMNISENESVEITKNDIVDPLLENVSITPVKRGNVNNSVCSSYSQETVIFPNNNVNENNSVLRINSHLFDLPVYKDVSCQTENVSNQEMFNGIEEELISCIRSFTSRHQCDISNLKDVSHTINFINKCINKLTTFRDCLFKSYCSEIETMSTNANIESRPGDEHSENYHKSPDRNRADRKRRKKVPDADTNNDKNVIIKGECMDLEDILTLPIVKNKVSVIERVKQELVIGTESGEVCVISLETGAFTHTFNITSVPITSLLFDRGYNDFVFMYVGSYDMVLKSYDFHNRKLLKACRIDDKISCMDSMWGYIFLGCLQGSLMSYSIQKRKIDLNEKHLGSSIMVIKAAWEGARKVLIIGCKQAPVHMRCAVTGLYLRNFSNDAISPTVYSMILDKTHLYCGTASNSILVFSFYDGKLVNNISGEDYNGISCMKMYNGYLFAGCYTGSVCVYNLNTKQHVAALKGPGGGILSMEVFNNQIVVGTLSNEFCSIPIPYEILTVDNSYRF